MEDILWVCSDEWAHNKKFENVPVKFLSIVSAQLDPESSMEKYVNEL